MVLRKVICIFVLVSYALMCAACQTTENTTPGTIGGKVTGSSGVPLTNVIVYLISFPSEQAAQQPLKPDCTSLLTGGLLYSALQGSTPTYVEDYCDKAKLIKISSNDDGNYATPSLESGWYMLWFYKYDYQSPKNSSRSQFDSLQSQNDFLIAYTRDQGGKTNVFAQGKPFSFSKDSALTVNLNFD